MLAMVGIETIGIVVLIGIVIFGGSKIPELARSLGRAKGEFQKGLSEGDASKNKAAKPADKEPASTDES